MKAAALCSAILFAVTPCLLKAETPATAAPELSPAQQAFLNLPEEAREEYLKIFGEAVRLFQQKRIFETLEQVHLGKKIFDTNPDMMNIEASCYVEIRNFERALEIYKQAEAMAPANPSVKFNIAEMYFVMKNWQEAHDRFTAAMTLIPEGDLALGRLVEFKLLLCKLRLGKQEEAFALANKYDFLDDSPFHYYANAVLAFEAKDELEAEKWLQKGVRVFQNPAILSPWQDTLIEAGYIKGSYGGDAAP